jgi:hypothetical protein
MVVFYAGTRVFSALRRNRGVYAESWMSITNGNLSTQPGVKQLADKRVAQMNAMVVKIVLKIVMNIVMNAMKMKAIKAKAMKAKIPTRNLLSHYQTGTQLHFRPKTSERLPLNFSEMPLCFALNFAEVLPVGQLVFGQVI